MLQDIDARTTVIKKHFKLKDKIGSQRKQKITHEQISFYWHYLPDKPHTLAYSPISAI